MLGIGISGEEAQVAVTAVSKNVYGGIFKSYFENLKKDFSGDKKIQNFVKNKEKDLKKWYNSYLPEKFALMLAVRHCAIDIQNDSISHLCIKKMTAIVKNDSSYSASGEVVIDLIVAAGVIYDD